MRDSVIRISWIGTGIMGVSMSGHLMGAGYRATVFSIGGGKLTNSEDMPKSSATDLSPKKLIHTKWTVVAPSRNEKHFLVTRVLEPEPPTTAIDAVEIEAVYTKRTRIMSWRELTDPTRWRRGWV